MSSFNTIKVKKLKALKFLIPFTAFFFACVPLMSQQQAPSSMSNPLVVTMVAIIVLLAVLIYFLSSIVTTSAELQQKKEKSENKSSAKQILGITIAFVLFSSTLFAQTTPAQPAQEAASGFIGNTTFYVLATVILLEIAVISILAYNIKLLVTIRKKAYEENEQPIVAAKEAKSTLSWWDKFNKFKTLEEESTLDLGHEYDGIRELNNRLPPWWLYGFYITILFAAIYLYRYHVSHSGPSSDEEYQVALTEAQKQQDAFSKKQSNKIDENSVKLLTSKTDLDEGKNVYIAICAACHRPDGGGNVGPNLTDDYWIHGGSINAIFKTVKYGYPEKGMQSWKDQLTANQMAQVSSYIKSMRGTNPPNPKEKQGDLYTESATAISDSTKPAVKDSMAVLPIK